MFILRNKYLISAAVTGILLLYFFLDARKLPFPQCPFYMVFDLYCPGCGSQRAMSALLHGDIISSLHNNVLLVIFLPMLFYSGIVSFISKGKKTIAFWYDPLFVKMVMLVVLSFWLLRNLPVYPFSTLAPLT